MTKKPPALKPGGKSRVRKAAALRPAFDVAQAVEDAMKALPFLDFENPRSKKFIEELDQLDSVIHNSPAMRKFREQVESAVAGNRESLVKVVADSGIGYLGYEPLRQQIYALDPERPADRRTIERIVRALRGNLLHKGPRGRPPETPVDAALLALTVQDAFDTAPRRVKRSYRNPAARQMDVKALTDHVTKLLSQRYREPIAAAIPVVLERKPGVTKSFGVDVVAEALSRSSRWIRSTQKKKRV